jgi:predicted nucleic acid-binding protein
VGVIVADTSILIDTLRGVPAAREAIIAARDARHEVSASVVTKIELLSGMRSPEKSATRRLIASLTWIAVSDEIAEAAGELARAYRRSHQGIGVVDYVIAATVEHLNAQLWTLNVRHFPMFPELAAAPY